MGWRGSLIHMEGVRWCIAVCPWCIQWHQMTGWCGSMMCTVCTRWWVCMGPRAHTVLDEHIWDLDNGLLHAFNTHAVLEDGLGWVLIHTQCITCWVCVTPWCMYWASDGGLMWVIDPHTVCFRWLVGVGSWCTHTILDDVVVQVLDAHSGY